LQVQADAADVGLVGDGLGVELQDDGVAHPPGEVDGLFGAAGDLRLDGRDAVGGEDLLRLELGEDGAAGVPDVGDQVLDRLAVGVGLVGGFGRLVDAAQVVRVAPHVGEGAGGGVGELEGRDAGAVQDGLAGGNLGPAHPAREHGLARLFA